MIEQRKIDKVIERAKDSYNKSDDKARKEFGKFTSGDIRPERKILNKFKNRK